MVLLTHYRDIGVRVRRIVIGGWLGFLRSTVSDLDAWWYSVFYMSSLPTLEIEADPAILSRSCGKPGETFNHKKKKFRSTSKTSLSTPRAVSATHAKSMDGQRFTNLSDYRLGQHANAPKKKSPRQFRATTEPSVVGTEKVELRERVSRFKPSSSLELNLFQKKYRHVRLPVHSISTDPTAVGNHGYLLFKQRGKKPKKRWLSLTNTHLRCYRAVTVSF